MRSTTGMPHTSHRAPLRLVQKSAILAAVHTEEFNPRLVDLQSRTSHKGIGMFEWRSEYVALLFENSLAISGGSPYNNSIVTSSFDGAALSSARRDCMLTASQPHPSSSSWIWSKRWEWRPRLSVLLGVVHSTSDSQRRKTSSGVQTELLNLYSLMSVSNSTSDGCPRRGGSANITGGVSGSSHSVPLCGLPRWVRTDQAGEARFIAAFSVPLISTRSCEGPASVKGAGGGVGIWPQAFLQSSGWAVVER